MQTFKNCIPCLNHSLCRRSLSTEIYISLAKNCSETLKSELVCVSNFHMILLNIDHRAKENIINLLTYITNPLYKSSLYRQQTSDFNNAVRT